MKLNRINLEDALYGLAIVLALGLRLLALDRAPLNDAEAGLALQAYDLLRSGGESLDPHPFYILGTALINFIFGASTFTARFLPALAGTALAGLPYLLRDQLGRRAALILAFFFALDPGLLGSSVQAGSWILGPVCLLFALAGWSLGKPVMAGIFAGLACLGGPLVWPGVLGFGAAFFVSGYRTDPPAGAPAFDWRKAGLAALASLGLMGTLFFLVPAGLSSAAASIPAYFGGWGQTGGVSALLLVGALIAYEALALVLGAGTVLRSLLRERSGIDTLLAIWWAAALILALVYPSRQVMDLVWVVAPTLALAARRLDTMLSLPANDRLAVGGQAALITLLLLLLINLVISWPQTEVSSANQLYRWLVLGLALVLLIAEAVLVAWGWSLKIALSGLAWGTAGVLALYTISAGLHAAGLTPRWQAELWRSGPAFADEDLTVSTVRDYTQWQAQLRDTPQVVISGLASPALRWALRDTPGLRVEDVLSTTAQPEILLTSDLANLMQGSAYTGQDLVLSTSPAWDLITPPEWITWLIYRQVQADAWQTQKMILWVRADQFPGAAEQSNQP